MPIGLGAPHSGAALLRRTSVLSQRLKTLAQAIVKQNSRPFWAAPRVRRKFGAQRRIAQGEFISPEQFNHRRVEPPFGRRNPKKKDTTYVVSFFFVFCCRKRYSPESLAAQWIQGFAQLVFLFFCAFFKPFPNPHIDILTKPCANRIGKKGHASAQPSFLLQSYDLLI